MKVKNLEFHDAGNGKRLAILNVLGIRGEKISLTEQGIGGEIIFCTELPKSQIGCTFFPEEGMIELGGTESESSRQIFLITGGETHG